ncbi:MAG TPA: hypothetical protein VH116_04470, partial [Gemmatimonadales bacterium]|nr:hypothetical protein [Gemmatimonadales bacterium]
MHLRHRVALIALCLPAGVGAQTALPLKHSPEPTVPAITARDLMTRLYIFSDDSMQGREAGTPGNVKATDYIAHETRRFGLVPGGEGGTYFQTIPLKTRGFDTTSMFAVGGAPLVAVTDYLALGPRSLENSAVPIVYGGDISDSTRRITAEQASGKLVVFRAPPQRLRSLRSPPTEAGAAAAVAFVVLDSVPRQFIGFLTGRRTFVDDPAGGPPQGAPVFLVSHAAAARMFTTPFDQLAPGAAGGTAAVAVRFDVQPVAAPARNVVAILPGGDAKL